MRSVLTFNGGMDQDTSPMYLKPGDVISRRNARVSVGNGSDAFVNKPLMGTVPVTIAFPQGVNKVVGWTPYLEGGGFIYFNYNSLGSHGIYWLDGVTNTILLINSVLDFQVGSIVDARVIGDLLVWTDNIHDPRIISISRAITTLGTGIITGQIFENGIGSISGTVKGFIRDEIVGSIFGVVQAYAENQIGNGDITGTVQAYFTEGTITGVINEQI